MIILKAKNKIDVGESASGLIGGFLVSLLSIKISFQLFTIAIFILTLGLFLFRLRLNQNNMQEVEFKIK